MEDAVCCLRDAGIDALADRASCCNFEGETGAISGSERVRSPGCGRIEEEGGGEIGAETAASVPCSSLDRFGPSP